MNNSIKGLPLGSVQCSLDIWLFFCTERKRQRQIFKAPNLLCEEIVILLEQWLEHHRLYQARTCVCQVTSVSSAAPWTIAHQAHLCIEFYWQECWSGLPCPSPGDLPNPGIKPTSLMSPALAGGLFTTSATWEALYQVSRILQWCGQTELLV